MSAKLLKLIVVQLQRIENSINGYLVRLCFWALYTMTRRDEIVVATVKNGWLTIRFRGGNAIKKAMQTTIKGIDTVENADYRCHGDGHEN